MSPAFSRIGSGDRAVVAIADDLIALGGVIHTLAAPQRLDLAGVLGAMYVLESSRLGAKVLLAEVAQSSEYD